MTTSIETKGSTTNNSRTNMVKTSSITSKINLTWEETTLNSRTSTVTTSLINTGADSRWVTRITMKIIIWTKATKISFRIIKVITIITQVHIGMDLITKVITTGEEVDSIMIINTTTWTTTTMLTPNTTNSGKTKMITTTMECSSNTTKGTKMEAWTTTISVGKNLSHTRMKAKIATISTKAKTISTNNKSRASLQHLSCPARTHSPIKCPCQLQSSKSHLSLLRSKTKQQLNKKEVENKKTIFSKKSMLKDSTLTANKCEWIGKWMK